MDTFALNIEPACVRNLDEILDLRSQTAPKDLKPLSPDEIAYKIHEFYLVIMDGVSVGCFRVFVPEQNQDVIELGSVVSISKGVGREIVSFAQKLSQSKQKNMIAITGGKLDNTLEKQGWKLATEKYPERMKESLDDKKCWEFTIL